MQTKNVQIQKESSLPGRNKIARQLEKTLQNLPLTLKGISLKLSAYVGLGRIVYIDITGGRLTREEIGEGISIITKDSSGLYFEYNNQNFELRYA